MNKNFKLSNNNLNNSGIITNENYYECKGRKEVRGRDQRSSLVESVENGGFRKPKPLERLMHLSQSYKEKNDKIKNLKITNK